MRPEENSTADSISLQCSATSTVGDSPVVPTITMPSVPSATCQSMSAFRRGVSRAPSASIGVTMATRLPESMRNGDPRAFKERNFSREEGLIAPCRNALHHGGFGLRDGEILVGDHAQPPPDHVQELARG